MGETMRTAEMKDKLEALDIGDRVKFGWLGDDGYGTFQGPVL